MVLLEYCICICVCGCVVLAILGGMAIENYKYISFGGKKEGTACLIAAGIYLGIIFLIAYIKKRRKRVLREIEIKYSQDHGYLESQKTD
jgi:hypothetical protein